MKVFIDASVVLAALGSKTGGSNLVFKLAERRKIMGVMSRAVLEEVFRNAGKIKIPEKDVAALISRSALEIIAAPTFEEVEKYFSDVDEKDAHVVASAFASNSEYIVTLDKKHLLSKKIKGLDMLTPGELLKKI